MRLHWDFQPCSQLFLHGVMDPGESLKDFADRLKPSKTFYKRCSEVINRTEKFMKHNTSFKNGSILMVGSVGKRTALGDEADIDIMYYLNDTSLDDLSKLLPKINERLKQHVQNDDLNWASDLMFEKTTPFSVQFKLSIGNQPHIPVDFLPVVDILGRNSKANREKLYTRMMKMDRKKQKYCQRCVSKVQLHFVRQVPRNLKDVIRVIKSWCKKIKKDEPCKSVVSYFCELVVIRTWMNQGKPGNQDIDLRKFVKLVLYELCFCEIIRITWPELYLHHDFTDDFNGPMVLDPANPFCNVAPKIQHAAVISREARQLLLKRIDPVKSLSNVVTPRVNYKRGNKHTEPNVVIEIGEARQPCFNPKNSITSASDSKSHLTNKTRRTKHTETSDDLETGEASKVRSRCSRNCYVASLFCCILFVLLVVVLITFFVVHIL